MEVNLVNLGRYHSAKLLRTEEYTRLTEQEASAAFSEFLQQVPSHVENLISQYNSAGLSGAKEPLDFSPKSLEPLWRWFLKCGRIRPYTKAEREHMETLFGRLGPTMVGSHTLTEETELMVQDIGLYLAEVFLKNYPHLRWDYVRDSPDDIFYQNPALFGFLDDSNGRAFEPAFQPIHMVGVQAAKLLNNADKKLLKAARAQGICVVSAPNDTGPNVEDLVNLYRRWEQYAIAGQKKVVNVNAFEN